jgi:hypothetical protein
MVETYSTLWELVQVSMATPPQALPCPTLFPVVRTKTYLLITRKLDSIVKVQIQIITIVLLEPMPKSCLYKVLRARKVALNLLYLLLSKSALKWML